MTIEQESNVLRAARNQALYREINEKIEDLNRAFDQVFDLGSTWICECADENCTEPLELTLGAYEAIRAHPARFAVLPGHVYPEAERIVDEHETYVVVEKVGVAREFVRQHDPRASR